MVKTDDAPFKNDYGPEPTEEDYAATRERMRQRRFVGTDDVESDDMPPKAMHRHEQMMKMIVTLDSAVTKLESRLEVVLEPERPQPHDGRASEDRPEDNDPYSVIEARHRMYLEGFIGVLQRIEKLSQRVDL